MGGVGKQRERCTEPMRTWRGGPPHGIHTCMHWNAVKQRELCDQFTFFISSAYYLNFEIQKILGI